MTERNRRNPHFTPSFARLRYNQNRRAETSALLRPVCDRFTEGFDTADLRSARTLLEALFSN